MVGVGILSAVFQFISPGFELLVTPVSIIIWSS